MANGLGACSQAEWASALGICNRAGVYMMNIKHGGKPNGWVVVCSRCEERYGNDNFARAGYVQRKDRTWKPPKQFANI